MASTYALPLGGSHVRSYGSPSHSHSYSLHDEKSAPWTAALDGHAKKTSVHSVHSHSGHEANHGKHRRSELQSRPARNLPYSTLDSSRPSEVMKGRHGGDAGHGHSNTHITRTKSYGFASAPEENTVSGRWLTTKEALTALLIPLPYLLASFAYPISLTVKQDTPKSYATPFDELKDTVAGHESLDASVQTPQKDAFIQACCLASATLLLVGVFGSVIPSGPALDRRKTTLVESGSKSRTGSALDLNVAKKVVARIYCVGLPFYATMLLGGPRTSLILLTTLATGLNATSLNTQRDGFVGAWKNAASQRKLTCFVLLLSFILDFSGVYQGLEISSLIKGHIALAMSVLFMPFPLPTTRPSILSSRSTASDPSTSAVPSTPISPSTSSNNLISGAVSPLIATPKDVRSMFISGLVLTAFTIIFATMTSHPPSITPSTIIYSTLSIGSALGLILFSSPFSLNSQKKVGLALGYTVTTILGFFTYLHSWQDFTIFGVLSGFSFAAAAFDTASKNSKATPHNHKHHQHGIDHLHGSHSRITGFLLNRFPVGSIVHSILIEKDSRRIAYFACLNLSFMLVQFFYGFVSGSLGLLTDSIHMLFDCAGLAVGLAAAVMSKWPADIKFPYGYGKVDTLSGFANGIFLMLVSVEIIFDAFERLFEGHELHRLNELLVVSILGFLVNMVGLTAFGHAHHHGHDHGHSHRHDEGDGHSHGHSHSHDNENMQGIFLHILADALGSVAVIISTLLTKYYGWSGWDPIASCIIAVLIFASAIPLVKSAGLRLLLSLPADVEYGVRNTLQEINSLRGVIGYSVPRFWLEDAGTAHADAHAHAEAHAHEKDDHSLDHVHQHSHGDHDHSHSHSYSHAHSHTHSHGHDHHDHHDHHSHAQPHSHVHDHGHGHDHKHGHEHKHDGQQRVLGVIHIIAARNADQEDVRLRTEKFLKERNLNVVVHVEREGDRCWCGGGLKTN